ncbi:hypothetical protein C8R45DRAFT_1113249 [Mycena sanguinolenta]|nr:hypothetical protein C8R45DRAFT_1113249 [Mycena sanguinolenta]
MPPDSSFEPKCRDSYKVAWMRITWISLPASTLQLEVEHRGVNGKLIALHADVSEIHVVFVE